MARKGRTPRGKKFNKKTLILCEGKVEVLYFQMLKEKYSKSNVSISIIEQSTQGSKLVDKAIKNLKSYFEDRCEDLKIIKEKIEENPGSTEKFKVDFGIIIDLLNFIDLENKKIQITDENKDDINNIFYLFQNKIVTSFLTREVKTALGYQN